LSDILIEIKKYLQHVYRYDELFICEESKMLIKGEIILDCENELQTELVKK